MGSFTSHTAWTFCLQPKALKDQICTSERTQDSGVTTDFTSKRKSKARNGDERGVQHEKELFTHSVYNFSLSVWK
jgi:hypothetical protein